MANEVLKEYFEKFDELPFLLTTMSYDDEDYKILMMQAINRDKPLTEEEISDYFEGTYDLVTTESSTRSHEKSVDDLINRKMLV